MESTLAILWIGIFGHEAAEAVINVETNTTACFVSPVTATEI